MDPSYQYRTPIPALLYHLEEASLTLETVLTFPILYVSGGYPGNYPQQIARRVTRAIIEPLPPSSQVEWCQDAGFSPYSYLCAIFHPMPATAPKIKPRRPLALGEPVGVIAFVLLPSTHSITTFRLFFGMKN